ncbi:MAG: hypothetical protein FJ146_08760 [Deltaproteobacteria bacterium]|nr:hypothetical protein [Deltaproteobacteria bacterium]
MTLRPWTFALALISLAHTASAITAPQCVALGDRCDFANDCCSGYCSYQTCMLSDTSTGMCIYAGDACSTDGECCSGYCGANGACE